MKFIEKEKRAYEQIPKCESKIDAMRFVSFQFYINIYIYIDMIYISIFSC